MPYTKDLHANLGYVDKRYKLYLDSICELDKRSVKAELEALIMQKYIELGSPTLSK